MANCGQACPYNTLDGCKVKEYNTICPLTNMATPITEYQMTNADRIRATDDELATILHAVKMGYRPWCDYHCENEGDDGCENCIKQWLQQPAEGD